MKNFLHFLPGVVILSGYKRCDSAILGNHYKTYIIQGAVSNGIETS